MKRLLFFFMFLSVSLCLCAQGALTFTVTNADGIEIKYTATTTSNVKIVANNYQGRVVVPSTVTYENVEYTVNEVGSNAFAQCSGLSYVELPSTITTMGIKLFYQSGVDTVMMNSPEIPVNPYGNPLTFDIVKNFFGNSYYASVVVMVPQGRLNYFRINSAWGQLPFLTAPGAVAVTLFGPANSRIVMHNIVLKDYTQNPGYFTRFFEVGDLVWLAAYRNSYDTLFMGWDKGDVYLTEITGPDTLRPVYARIGYGTLNANNVSTVVRFNGQLGYLNGVSNYVVSANTPIKTLFSNGLWIRGTNMSSGQNFIDVTKFVPGDYVPGPLTVDGLCRSDMATRQAFNRVWSVSRDEIDDFIAHVGTPGYSIPENILTWPGNGGEGYASQLAPYYDADSNGLYEPQHGDYPLIKGDRMVFSIFNDHCVHYETGSYSMGHEIHLSAYAFDEPSLANTVFLSYKIINRSSNTYRSYLASFTDFDLGYAYDDFIGCDVRAGMAYAFNGMQTDMDYPGVPPAQGSIILAGPHAIPDGIDNQRVSIPLMQIYFPDSLARYQLANGTYDTVALNADADLYYPLAWSLNSDNSLPSNNSFINGVNYGNGIVDDERLGMTSFMYYENINSNLYGEPTGFSDYYYYIEGRWKDGSPMLYGANGTTGSLPCLFMFPNSSDPLHWGTSGIVPDVNADSWTEFSAGNAPGDRRGVQSVGPFLFHPGAEETLDVAYATAFGTSTPYSSVEQLQSDALELRRQFVRDTTDGGRAFTYMPYSAPILSIANADLPSMQLYPNPATNEVTIALGDGLPVNIDLYDIRGHKVRSLQQASGRVQINLSGLPRGIYMLRCGANTAKLVVQ